MIGSGLDPQLLADRAAYEQWAAERPLPPDVRRMPAPALGLGSFWIARRDVEADAPVVVYVHGGGFRVGSPRTGAVVGAAIAARVSVRILTVGYSLAPEHPFPTAAAEVTLALEALLRHEPAVPVMLAGDSAGANLVLFALRHSGIAAARVRGAALLCPLVDLTDAACASPANSHDTGLSTEVFAAIRRDYLSALHRAGPDDPDVSPVRARLAGLPPLFVQYSAAELLGPSIAGFVTRARAHGVDVTVDRWARQSHLWQRFAGDDPASDGAVDRLARWLRQRLAGGTSVTR
ncbi:hypothetical protein ASF88_16690 [Leifsonia sp. Leaf336]|uniref:alpha/beta hydrolase n=1 Tax=Leifsonia sp. Leaf336 TaxID=1736341 RepID=UPI00070029E0|nr:alpha/beta hydrolase [Leifsonia sp. Leaf336]KQR50864.1 hypothetical protein ASF88_16690 [Leifsonia sp. Leaf336]